MNRIVSKKISKRGVIVVPKDICDFNNIVRGQTIFVITVNSRGQITLTPRTRPCVFCGEEHTTIYRNKPLCSSCAKNISKDDNNLDISFGRKH